MTALAPLLEAFFFQRLGKQRQASPNTIASYRDTFRLLLRFAEKALGKKPADFFLADLEAPMVTAFLDSLEAERKNSARSRNARLSAIRAFFHYVAIEVPEHSALIQRVLAIPPKRFDRKTVEFLTQQETDALLAAPDTSCWIGRRDRAVLLLAEQTGLRVSELRRLTRADIEIEGPGLTSDAWARGGRSEQPRYGRRLSASCEPGSVNSPLNPRTRSSQASAEVS
jgi:integrase/recombinase XerD